MATSVNITGSSQIDELKRKKAVEKVLELTTDELERLASLKDSAKARSYLQSAIKFATLKTFM
jgi:hypothetical protein